MWREIAERLLVYGTLTVASLGLLVALLFATWTHQDEPIMDQPAGGVMLGVAVAAVAFAIWGASRPRRLLASVVGLALTAAWFAIFPWAGVGFD